MRTCIQPMWNILIINYITNSSIWYTIYCVTNIWIWNTRITWQGYWLQVSWGWHDSVETCRSVIICEMIVHWLVIVQNNKRCAVQRIKIKKIHNIVYTGLFVSPWSNSSLEKMSRPLKFTTDSNNSMGKSVSVGESEATTSTLPPAWVRTCSVLSGSC